MRMWRAQGLNIPLSMDGPHPITTKRGACVLEPVCDVGAHVAWCGTGEKAVVFDCVVNTTVIDDVKADRTGAFRHFVCELCIQYIGTKVGVVRECMGSGCCSCNAALPFTV